jgi:ATP-binding protein involved in chromosome partitioning
MAMEQDLVDRLRTVTFPGIDRDIVALGYVKGVRMDGDGFRLHVELSPSAAGVREEIETRIHGALAPLGVRYHLDLRVAEARSGAAIGGGTRPTAAPEPPPDPLAHIPVKIAVSSGKGGVGKSTVAVNLALAFAGLGRRTGLLDLDIYGPSIPIMFGLEDTEPMLDERRQKLLPLERYDVRNMSIGYLLDRHTPVIWRGPMMTKAIDQLMRDVDWEGTEVLVFDLPPGTGDVQLSLAQKVRLSGAVVVTTPQDVALIDAGRGVAMFQKTEVPVLGIVENMSYFLCPDCGGRHAIFGEGGGEREAARLGIPLLGQIPIDARIGRGGDQGRPIVFEHPECPASLAFREVAIRVLEVVGAGA